MCGTFRVDFCKQQARLINDTAFSDGFPTLNISGNAKFRCLMKKIMLIGDSIRLGYQAKAANLLEGKALVAGPDDNCRFSAYTLFHLSTWVPDDDFDVIQWNNGQWDTCRMPDGKIHTPLAAYLELQERIAAILLKKTKRLIFATTTPVWPETQAPMRQKHENRSVAAKLGLRAGWNVLPEHVPTDGRPTSFRVQTLETVRTACLA